MYMHGLNEHLKTSEDNTALLMSRMDNQQGPTAQHMERCSESVAAWVGGGVWGRMDTHICMAEFLLCSPGTITPKYKIRSFVTSTKKVTEHRK